MPKHWVALAVAIAVAIIIVILISTKTNAAPFIHRNDWMKKYHDKNLLELYIPASHNSAGYRTTLAPVLNSTSTVASVYNNFTLTQELNIYDQMRAGVRLLDIRVNTEMKDIPYISHTAFCIPLKKCFDDIVRFLNENPTEVIIILLKRDSHFSNINWSEIAPLIDQYFFGIDVPSKAAKVSVGEIIKNKRRVVIINENNADIGCDTHLWTGELVRNYWYNTNDTPKLINMVRKTNENISPEYLHITDFILTPDMQEDIEPALIPLTKAPRSLKAMNLSLIDTMTADLFPRPTACMMDFVDDKRIDMLIQLNEKKIS